jgi:hypothetical protein
MLECGTMYRQKYMYMYQMLPQDSYDVSHFAYLDTVGVLGITIADLIYCSSERGGRYQNSI